MCGYLSQRNEALFSFSNLNTNIHGSSLYILAYTLDTKLETVPASFSG